MIQLYSFASKKNQDKIKVLLNNRNKEISANNIEVYYDAITENIISFTTNIQNNLFKLAKDSIEEKLKSTSRSESSSELSNRYGFTILNLIITGYWKNTSKINELIELYKQVSKKFIIKANEADALEISRLLELYTTPENYDYKNADLDDFTYLNKAKLKELKQNKNLRKKIIEQLKKEVSFSDSKHKNAKLKELFFYLIAE